MTPATLTAIRRHVAGLSLVICGPVVASSWPGHRQRLELHGTDYLAAVKPTGSAFLILGDAPPAGIGRAGLNGMSGAEALTFLDQLHGPLTHDSCEAWAGLGTEGLAT